MKITGAEALIKSLIEEKVEVIFGYPGGASIPIYDALYDYQEKIYHILVRHEQGAVHAAEGYARVTGRAGVCFTTSGPGATNLITGITNAMMDSTPLVCFTGQVASSLIGTDAFQEADVIGLTAPITKWNYQITNAEEIPWVVKKAFYIAQNGRPGPVVIDIARDIQMNRVDFIYPKTIDIKGFKPTLQPNEKQIKLAAQLINHAQRPYLLVGHGVLIAKAHRELRQFVEKTGIPTAATLHGLSSLPSSHPLFVGLLGMHGNYAANMLTNKADVIIALGMRFDDRVTGRLSAYAQKAKIIHIDIDPAELNKNVKTEIPIVSDVKIALKKLIPLVKKNRHPHWLREFHQYQKIEEEKVIKKQLTVKDQIKMAQVVSLLSKKTNQQTIIITDVGQHQMITARYFKFKEAGSFVSSGGLGTMGFGIPAAIGVKVAFPQKEVIVIVGDGGFQMTVQELGTIMQEKLAIKVIILNNQYLGMVRQWQELFFNKRYSFTYLKNPDFIQLAQSYGIRGMRVQKHDQLGKALDELLTINKPFILEAIVEKEDKVFPIIPPGGAVNEVLLE